MNPRHQNSIRCLLAIFRVLAVLVLAASLLFLAALDWERLHDTRERLVASAYKYAWALIQERLMAARLLAEHAAQAAQPMEGAPSQATIILLAPDGSLISSSSGRSLPRLSSLAGGLAAEALAGFERDDEGRLVVVASYPAPGGLVVAALPFTPDDVQAIREATGLESSFLAGGVRVATTLRDRQGQTVVGRPLPDAEWTALLTEAGRLWRTYDPDLEWPAYEEIALPLYGLDGELVGAHVAGHPVADQWTELWQWAWPWLATLLAGSMAIGLLGFWLERSMLQPLCELERGVAALADRRDLGALPAEPRPLEFAGLVGQINQVAEDRSILARESSQLNNLLVQTQALTALGQVAAGVAHDLNNPLTTIMGLVDIILTANVDPDTQRDLAIIKRQAERSGRIVRSLLSLALRQRAELQWVSLNDLVAQTLELLSYQARVANIQCTLDLDQDLPLTWADPSGMQQVLFNLIINAMQAMATTHGRGNLRIESSWAAPSVGAPHGCITLCVQDSGSGIDDWVWTHLFQPYFTTKGPHGGTGLGLSIASSIVRRHNGRIWAENNPSGGATFSVRVPVVPEPPQAAPASDLGAHQHLLLADSDRQRLGHLAGVLRRQGYQLSTAGDGLMARHKMEAESFDLVLCALDMARLDGRDLYSWACSRSPQLARRLVFIASAHPRGEAEAFLQATRALVLRPPWHEDTILAVVSQTLRLLANTSDGSSPQADPSAPGRTH